MHIVVQNPNKIPLWGVRVLGRSMKDSTQIGRFGSGLKEAICLLTRLGVEFFVYSGKCRIDFSTQTFDEYSEICFKLSEERGGYEPEKWHPMGLDPKFGQYDWTDPWQALREIFCNAIDEDFEMMYHDIASDPSGKEGATRFYIETTPSILKAYGDIPNKILRLGNPEYVMFDDSKGGVLKKSELGNNVQIFHKGIWVQQKECKSLFDYDLSNIRLTESRTSDWFGIQMEVNELLNKGTFAVLSGVFSGLFLENHEHLYEKHAFGNFASGVSHNSENWRNAWNSVLGDNAVATLGSMTLVSKIQEAGYIPITVKSSMLECCERAGITTYRDVLSESDETDCIVISKHSDHLDDIWNLLKQAGLTEGKSKPVINIFDNSGDQTPFFVGPRNKELFLDEKISGSLLGKCAIMSMLSQYLYSDNGKGNSCMIAVKLVEHMKDQINNEAT